MKQSNVNTSNYSKKKKRLFLVVMCLGTLLICLSLLELAVRIISPQSDVRRKDLFFQYEPFVGVGGIPNKKGIFATKSFKTAVTLNNEGLRDYDHDKANTKNKFRIITLGDSFTWGHGVNNDQIYMKVLERIDPNIETINMGGSGGDPPKSLKTYMHGGIKYEHNVVLLGFYIGNDIVARYPRDNDSPPQWGFDNEGKFALIGKMKSQEAVNMIRRKSEEKFSPTRKRDFSSRIHYWFIRHFQLCTFIDNYRDCCSNMLKGSSLYTRILKYFGKENKRAYGFLNYCRETDPEDVEYGWKLLAETLKMLKDYSEQANAKLYVVFIPHQVQISQELYYKTSRKYRYNPSEFDLEKPNRKLSKLCDNIKIDYLDLLPVMRKEVSKGNKLYFGRDVHWNADGHSFAAKEIYDDMKGRGWIK
ncbi:MAG: hypothetical protein GY777_02440 [Candidatus Brocadiaceae bacterium]|nr:hypothetical protein [Candidatus Brocadiaceae bacterium]